jgi:hypothetical protein
MVEVLPCAGRVVNGLLHGSAIFRMDALETQLDTRSGRSIKLKNSECFI